MLGSGKLPRTVLMIHYLIIQLHLPLHRERKGHTALPGGQQRVRKGDVCDGLGGHILSSGVILIKHKRAVVLGIDLGGRGGVIVVNVLIRLGQGDAPVVVHIRSEIALSAQRIAKHGGKIAGPAGHGVPVGPLPIPAGFAASGAAEHFIIQIAKQHPVRSPGQALADERAGIARIQNDHLLPWNLIQNFLKCQGVQAFLPGSIAENQGSGGIAGALVKDPVSADIQQRNIRFFCVSQRTLHHILKLRYRSDGAGRGADQGVSSGIRHEGFGQATNIVLRGGIGVFLFNEIITADQQRPQGGLRRFGGMPQRQRQRA